MVVVGGTVVVELVRGTVVVVVVVGGAVVVVSGGAVVVVGSTAWAVVTMCACVTSTQANVPPAHAAAVTTTLNATTCQVRIGDNPTRQLQAR
ncbi:MAG: hypothetical protein ACRDXC_09795 [Acidimicrobiales bacterium]